LAEQSGGFTGGMTAGLVDLLASKSAAENATEPPHGAAEFTPLRAEAASTANQACFVI
jgi:hypothetical protein